MGKQQPSKRQKAVEIARVLKIEIASLTEIDPSARQDMLDVLDDLIFALSFQEAF